MDTRKEIERITKKQTKHQQLKNIISEMKISLDELHSISDTAENRNYPQ